ncbi:MAG: hypothetical protein Q7S21_05700 [archaeon]|nr:hypothetical protein [archaeon]
MSYDKLITKINRIKAVNPNYIIEEDIGGKKLFILNLEEYKDCDPMLRSRKLCADKNKDIVPKIIEEMKDKIFRDFICCNFQDFCKKLKDEQIVSDRLIDDEIDMGEGTLKIYNLSSFGFVNVKKTLDDEQKNAMFEYLREKFLYQMNTNFRTQIFQPSFENNLLNPLKKIISILGMQNEMESYDKNHIEVNAKNQKIQDFLHAWQLHMFFEEYVNNIFEKESQLSAIRNPLIAINPSIYKDNKTGKQIINGFIELDGCIYKNNDGIVLVECKNSYTIDQRQFFPFVGKAWLIEKLYETDVTKCLVSTGRKREFFKEFGEFELNKIKIFGEEDYKKNYMDLRKFARTLQN